MRSSRTSGWLYSAAMPRGVTPCWSVSATWPPLCNTSSMMWTQPDLEASCMAVHFFKHTCSTWAPAAIRVDVIWRDSALTAAGKTWPVFFLFFPPQGPFGDIETAFWPKSRDDSFFPLTVWGEAPWSSNILTFSTKPALTARVRKVSPSRVFSSRVRLKDAEAHSKSCFLFRRIHVSMYTFYVINDECWAVTLLNERLFDAERHRWNENGIQQLLMHSSDILEKPKISLE